MFALKSSGLTFVHPDETSACSPSCRNSMETPMQPACNETSGECFNGCIEGYTGAQCLIPCGEHCVTCNSR